MKNIKQSFKNLIPNKVIDFFVSIFLDRLKLKITVDEIKSLNNELDIQKFLLKWLPKESIKYFADAYIYSKKSKYIDIDTVLLAETFLKFEYDKVEQLQKTKEDQIDALSGVYVRLESVISDNVKLRIKIKELEKQNEATKSGGQDTLLPRNESLPEQFSVGQVRQEPTVV